MDRPSDRGAANADVVVDMYAPIAADYEGIWAPLLREFGIKLLDALPLAGARRVLDLGCGVGTLFPDIRERAPHAVIVGTDLTEGMLRRGPVDMPRAVMDGTRLGFADAAFDAVVSCFVVFHFPDPTAALQAVLRATAPAGGMALAVWGSGQVFPAADVVARELDAIGAPPDPAAAGPPDGNDQVNTPDKLASVLRGAGYEDIRTQSAPWVRRWQPEPFVEYRARMGPSNRRLRQLDESARRDAIERIRERAAGLTADELTDRYEVVLGSGRAPG